MTAEKLPEVPRDFPGRIVLGIDPGTRILGYGALVQGGEEPQLLAAGALRAARDQDLPTRLGQLRTELDELLRRLRPAVVVLEEAFVGRNVQSALRVGESRGMVLSCAAAYGAEILQYPPAVAKRRITGHGGADKQQVALMVARELGLEEPPSPADVTDALALALTYVHDSRAMERLR